MTQAGRPGLIQPTVERMQMWNGVKLTYVKQQAENVVWGKAGQVEHVDLTLLETPCREKVEPSFSLWKESTLSAKSHFDGLAVVEFDAAKEASRSSRRLVMSSTAYIG